MWACLYPHKADAGTWEFYSHGGRRLLRYKGVYSGDKHSTPMEGWFLGIHPDTSRVDGLSMHGVCICENVDHAASVTPVLVAAG